MTRIQKSKPLKDLTTLGIGGPARFFCEAKSEKELLEALRRAREKKVPWYILGSGSNLVVSDKGFPGLIIKANIRKFSRDRSKVLAGAGNELLAFIRKINRLGLGGVERMAGIPGTIAGAIYGNAGAYGQEICENLRRVRIFDGRNFRWLSRRACRFFYRDSIFKKHKNWAIVEAEFSFKKGKPKELSRISREIIKLREKKYRPSLLCPGSFFKNIIFKNLPKSAQKKIPPDKVMYGKVSAGYLLEVVGAKGLSKGGIKIAKHHANLFYNSGGGKAQDIKKLAIILKDRVMKKFGVELEEEVQYLG
ncbi:UDP-N-acetylenolpyruvoylglucosamine reductase [Candidatus Giovannonibacteria bacterium RIFCSPHIGHO2_01_FULL_48_47]|nr:MAG: UDP-N-acetylenolpyruvoylglucosamine reductase [Candidatus Giovannonibacteria bacterium RIFCSPHIGHO2_01_FULL_48_47]OGF88523.1 MAG: UDP-N-acetylenolpyruvoylglucosamine reductase [Candidatus Giovannonibacteria bacterium RIFCSPLOWO2_01_FULL_48_47]OGF95422.1 MAG: UDP-N-acetylenolpyruvoylglucosamine reductase [Candidatus Giovannonibacteria bacterium RIFOXYC1_FULL_48_8]OGF95969.1 MAG: UDP-N-acetylenolpyruvoylglucosamine reductase [Candidatus Giovannonibacteria bacterium RIFOXYD1_FULL_48_21]